jgi:hypothetical protein
VEVVVAAMAERDTERTLLAASTPSRSRSADTALSLERGSYGLMFDPRFTAYSEWIVGNLHRAYAELDGREPGGRLDRNRALTEMVERGGSR